MTKLGRPLSKWEMEFRSWSFLRLYEPSVRPAGGDAVWGAFVRDNLGMDNLGMLAVYTKRRSLGQSAFIPYWAAEWADSLSAQLASGCWADLDSLLEFMTPHSVVYVDVSGLPMKQLAPLGCSRFPQLTLINRIQPMHQVKSDIRGAIYAHIVYGHVDGRRMVELHEQLNVLASGIRRAIFAAPR